MGGVLPELRRGGGHGLTWSWEPILFHGFILIVEISRWGEGFSLLCMSKETQEKGKRKRRPFKQMGAMRAPLLCLQHCAQVNMPKPSAYGAITSSRPELACVWWRRKQEKLLGLPAPLRVGTTMPLWGCAADSWLVWEGDVPMCGYTAGI